MLDIPASIGSTRCAGSGPVPFFPCVRSALSVLFVIGGSLAPALGTLSWSTRFSRRPGSRRYSVLKFNRDRDIPDVKIGLGLVPASIGGQPQNRQLRRFTGASDFLDASSAVSNNISVP